MKTIRSATTMRCSADCRYRVPVFSDWHIQRDHYCLYIGTNLDAYVRIVRVVTPEVEAVETPSSKAKQWPSVPPARR